MALGGRRSSRLVPTSSWERARTTGPKVRSAAVRASVVISGRSPGRTASASTSRSVARRSTWRMADASGGFSSGTDVAPRRTAISCTTSSGETTHVCHPVTAWAASRTSSSMARVRAPRSSGVSSGATRRLAPASDFTGTAMTRIVQGYRGGWVVAPWIQSGHREEGLLEPWYHVAKAVALPPLKLWFNWRMEGVDRVRREGPIIIAGNHLSYLDPLAHAYFVVQAGRRPRFLAKAELFDNPFLRMVLRGAGQIPVRRGSGASPRPGRGGGDLSRGHEHDREPRPGPDAGQDRGGPAVDLDRGPDPARGNMGWPVRVAQGRPEELRLRPPHLAEGGGARGSPGHGPGLGAGPGARATAHRRAHGPSRRAGGRSPVPLPQAMGVRLRLTA